MSAKKVVYRASIIALAVVTVLLLFLIVVVVPPDWVFTMLGWFILVLASLTLAFYIAGWSE